MIAHPTLSVSRQCQLLDVSRASVYRRPAPVSADDLRLMELIDRQYLARPFYGSRRMAAWLATQGFAVNRYAALLTSSSPSFRYSSRSWPAGRSATPKPLSDPYAPDVL